MTPKFKKNTKLLNFPSKSLFSYFKYFESHRQQKHPIKDTAKSIIKINSKTSESVNTPTIKLIKLFIFRLLTY